jgi:EmrB/QacA subfamily drug resistance transporter
VIGRLRDLPYERQVLIVYIFSLFMTVIDGTMVNVALPTMAGDFGVESTEVEWIAVGYLLAVATVIPAAGWVGDRFGTRRVFLVSLAAFTVASLLCGLAQSLDQLVLLRVLQGAGGGLLIPVGSAMLYRAFPMSERAGAAAAVLSVAVAAPAIGPLLGGILVDQASWRWIFLINLPIGIVALFVAASVLREDVHEHAGRFDVAGFVLSGGSISILLYTMSIGPEQGWTSTKVLGFAAVGVSALALCIVVELKIDEPMLALRLFRDHLFRTVNTAAVLIYAGFFGLIFLLPIYLQTLRGYSAFQSGLAQSPQAIGIVLISNVLGRRAYHTVGPKILICAGTAGAAIVTASFALTGLDTPLWQIGTLSFLRGLAIACVFLAIQTAVYGTTSQADTGRATSLYNAQRQFANASGVALAATVLTAGLHGHGDAATSLERLDAYRIAFVVLGVVMVPAVLIALRIRDADVAATRGIEPAASATVNRT